MTVVVDTSAILAMEFEEPGAEYALSRMQGALLSTVNLAEAMSRLIDRTGQRRNLAGLISRLNLHLEPFALTDAVAAADLRNVTRRFGLSLGDRACLALAQRLGLAALTADRAWANIDVVVTVELIG